MLSNPEYIDKLMYVPCIVPKRSAFVISPHKNVNLRVYSADLVRSVLDLPYMPKSIAQKFEFSVEYMAILNMEQEKKKQVENAKKEGRRQMRKYESMESINNRAESAQSSRSGRRQ